VNLLLIRRKLRPPPPPEWLVARPRLDERLSRVLARHPVVIVSATAGAGKTTAVANAAALMDRPLAWLTLDDTDTAPGRLLSYLEAALAGAHPAVEGLTRQALAARVAHPEAAGLLAEAVAGTPLLLVIDELERLGEAPEAIAVIEGLVRYAPPELRIVLISRRDVPLRLSPFGGAVAVIGEADLAFTADEASDALSRLGDGRVQAAEAVESTGGWVTGVLFQAWQSSDHVLGAGGEADPLHGYLSTQILEELSEAERDFLVDTSVLDLVTAARAEALEQPEPGARLVGLRARHLPVSWDHSGAMRAHPCFREYLVQRLERRGLERVRRIRRLHGRLLAREGYVEEATEELLRADAAEDALAAAERAIGMVIERLDYAVAERWLEALAHVGPSGSSPLTTAELMLAVGREEYRRGTRIADQLEALGEREPLARESTRAAAMMAWSYFHACRIDDLRAVLAVAEEGEDIAAVRYLLTLVDERPDERSWSPQLTGGAADGLVIRLHYWRGRFAGLVGAESSGWADAVSAPWRIAALRATGRLDEALALYERAISQGWAAVGLHAVVAVELMTDLGRRADAEAALVHGREIARRQGSLVWDMFSRLAEAKLWLRLIGDAASGRRVLDELEAMPASRAYHSTAEQLDTWYGLAQLMLGEDEGALERLRRAVHSMQISDRILELPAAAVYLAEAEWRAGDEEAADAAADIALDAGRRQGTNHLLLQALAEFPAVLSRRLDAEAQSDSAWHELGRALLTRGVSVDGAGGTVIELREFGRLAVLVDGVEVQPRISKSLELLALLAAREGGLTRDQALDALFDGRTDQSARSYLRQALHRLREVLPDGQAPELAEGRIQLPAGVRIASESQRFEALLGRAAALAEGERPAALDAALALTEAGEYLPAIRAGWAEERRAQLSQAVNDARSEAAELAFRAGAHRDALERIEAVLEGDPYRESAWRLLMRVSNALGADDRVIAGYRRCEAVLAEVGAEPSASTRALLTQLRR
jgi:ATP/maltotriose-dependent transcriptional regulator MalT